MRRHCRQLADINRNVDRLQLFASFAARCDAHFTVELRNNVW